VRVSVGTVFDGFTGGYFGRDAYGTKTCIATGKYDGTKWALFVVSDYPKNRFVVIWGSEIKAASEADKRDRQDTI
jgi:hypothetical protein